MNSTLSLPASDDYSPVRDIILLVLYAVTAFFSIFANFCVCKIIWTEKQMRSNTNLLIASMAASDVLAGVAILAQWLFCSEYMLEHGSGDYPCAFFKSLQVATYFLSTLTMVVIALNRYVGIFYWHKIRFNATAAIVSTWFIAIVFVAMTAVSVKIFKYFTSKELITCGVVLEFTKPFDSRKVRKIRVASVLIGQFLIPLLLTAFIYGRIVCLVMKRKIIGER
ncbi:putative G-protein coupled receptor 83-like protein, partial [Dinothrombium tinctorium]